MNRPPGSPADVQGDRPRPPPVALAISFVSLLAAAGASVTWPSTGADYSALVWILALIPVFLLAYYRGWRGAAIAAAVAMVVLVAVEIATVGFHPGAVDWWLVGMATAFVIPVTLGAGALSERLHADRVRALEMAYHDPLTNLANRRLLREHASTALARAHRTGLPVGMIFIDLVRFKRVNDTLGHAAGDEALQHVAARLASGVRACDMVARVGGDEFAILLPEIRSLEEAVGVARRVRERFAAPLRVAGHSVALHPRLGVALYPDHASSFDELLSRADPARGRRKRAEPEIVVHDPALAAGEGEEAAFEEDLRLAVLAGELTLHYQPVVSVPDRRLVGVEALVRFEHRELGLIPAADFIALAQHVGLIRDLDLHVLKTALRQARHWQDRGGPEWISVNLSPASFEDPVVMDQVSVLLETAGVEPPRLVLEVTEQMATRDAKWVADAVRTLRDLGVRFAVDDFGTGRSSLAYLGDFPAHLLKLDPAFTGRLVTDEKQRRLVEGVVGLARGLGLKVVAEGVETREQYERLAACGCDLVQGFYTGAPAPAAALAVPRNETARHA